MLRRWRRGADGQSEPLSKAVPRTGGRLEVYAENIPAGLPANAMAQLYDGRALMSRGGSGRTSRPTHSARIASKCVSIALPARSAFHAWSQPSPQVTSSIRPPRTASMGGLIWGISPSALHEATEVDPASARLTNTNLADYMVPVNADAPSIEVIMVPEHDTRVNPLGVKGIGEIGIVGMNAAIAHAVFHATGKRLRELPIRAEQLL